MESTYPARLHAVFAREKPIAVVFRRGPSKQVCTFLWDRKNNTFSLGQWLKGRIYERRTDLSPDGKYLIYFAMNAKWSSKTGGSWTAISKTPWLKALDLYSKGDCWEGGGLFLSNNEFWLNDRYFTPSSILRQSGFIKRNDNYKLDKRYGAECTGVYYPRLIRDGWELKGHEEKSKWNSVTVFEKSLPKNWLIRKIAHEQVGPPEGKGCYWDEHELINSESNEVIKGEDWEWAEVDGSEIFWASEGCIFRSKIQSRSKLSEYKMIFNFNNYKFEPREAPY